MNNRRVGLLSKIEKEVVGLRDSPLYKERIANKAFPVVGEGSPVAKIMFIGEAPGKNEALTGRPFVGASGKVLNKMLEVIGLDRNDVYVTNIVKDRPPQNRDPLPSEVALYGPYLNRQIDIIKPKAIATLGRFSMDYVMRMFGLEDQLLPIGQMHGKCIKTKSSYGQVEIITLYHPAVAIYNQNTKDILMKDFRKLKKYI